VKYTPEIAKKRSIFHGTSNSLPLVADPGGLHSTKKIKISFTTQQIYPLKISKKRSIFYNLPNSLPRWVAIHGPLGPKIKISFTTQQIYPLKISKTEYIKLVIPVTF